MSTLTVNIDMDAKCAECGKGGAAPSGICMGCTAKAMGHQPMRSANGKAVRARVRENRKTVRRAVMPQAGDNSDKLIKGYTDRLVDLMGQVSDIKGEIKEELKAAKGAGLDIRALLKVAKERTMEPDRLQKQLAFDFEVDAYRKAVGLPTEIAGERSEAA